MQLHQLSIAVENGATDELLDSHLLHEGHQADLRSDFQQREFLDGVPKGQSLVLDVSGLPFLLALFLQALHGL